MSAVRTLRSLPQAPEPASGLEAALTTMIALETSRGDLGLALGLGFNLLALTVGVSALTFALNRGVLQR